jgi:hypothetical protein
MLGQFWVVILPSEFYFLAADGTGADTNELWGAATELYRLTVRAFRLIELQKVVGPSEGLFRLRKRAFLLVLHKCTVSLSLSRHLDFVLLFSLKQLTLYSAVVLARVTFQEICWVPFLLELLCRRSVECRSCSSYFAGDLLSAVLTRVTLQEICWVQFLLELLCRRSVECLSLVCCFSVTYYLTV